MTNYSRSVPLSNGQIRGENLRNGTWPGGEHASPRTQFPTVGQDSPGPFTHRPQTPQRSFQGAAAGTHATPAPNHAHSGSQGETRGLPDGAAITTLDTYCTFTNIPGPGARTAYFAALGSCPGGALEERREPSGQRCAYARRCPEGVAAPLGCVIFFASAEIAVCMPCAQGLSVCARRGVVSLWKCQEMCSRETPKI